MIRSVLPFLAVLCLGAAAPQEHYLLLPSQATAILSQMGTSAVVSRDGDAAVVRVPDAQVGEWSQFIHSHFRACGGFVDVTEDMAKGLTAADLLERRRFAATRAPLQLKYKTGRDEKVADLIAAVDVNGAWDFLNELVGTLDDRSATTNNGTKAADFLAQRAADLGRGLSGFSVRKVATSSYPKQPSVVATYLGSKPNLGHVVIGGHMDTFSPNMPGADDDGTGTALVMDALKVVAEKGARFERTIDFIWYAAEERGLVGSTSVVRQFKAQNIPVDAVVQFDMTGYKSPRDTADIYIVDDYTNRTLNNTLVSILQTYLPNVKVGHTKCNYGCSDHASWTDAGVPAAFPFETAFNNHNGAIHTEDDVLSLVDKEHAANFARLALGYLGQVAVIQ